MVVTIYLVGALVWLVMLHEHDNLGCTRIDPALAAFSVLWPLGVIVLGGYWIACWIRHGRR